MERVKLSVYHYTGNITRKFDWGSGRANDSLIECYDLFLLTRVEAAIRFDVWDNQYNLLSNMAIDPNQKV